MCEIEVGIQRLGDGLMTGKLFAIVRGQCVNVVREWPQQFEDGLFDNLGTFVGYFGKQCQPRLALGQ